MTRIAFYAPLKPPDHPVPSGDRRMAQGFVGLLRGLGHEVELACRLRSFDRDGDPARQERLGRLGARLAERLAARLERRPERERPRLWFTYHLHHKAPDWLGPRVARRLGVPYVVAEASVAAKRADGPWAFGHAASRRAIAAADLVLALTRRDLPGLLPEVAEPSRLRLFPPFLDTAPFVAAAAARPAARAALAARHGLDADRPWLLAVAMMRADNAKLRSHAVLAEALARLARLDWRLLLVGDGAARGAVEGLMAALPAGRVRFLGQLPAAGVAEAHAAADLHVWPACAEAYGMALLEAQAAAVPVVAGDEGGVAEVVADGETGLLTAPRDPDALARAVAELLADPSRRRAMGARAQLRAVRTHDAAVAQGRLAEALAGLGVGTGEAAPCGSA